MTIVCLCASCTGLLSHTSFEPNPDFYVAQLYHRLMGDVVRTAWTQTPPRI